MQLSKFQNDFKELMLDQPEALEQIPEDLIAILRSDDIALPARLNVYRNNIIGGITEMLVATFPIIKDLVGEKFLEGMARNFIMQHPPEQGCLNTYGAGLGEFIEDFESAAGLPYLPDVARLEIAINEAYYARDDAAIAPEDIASMPLALRSSATLLKSKYPLLAIHDFCLRGHGADETLDLDAGGDFMMIYRPKLEIQFVSLEPKEYEILVFIQGGGELTQAIETFEDFDFQGFLARHIQLETFCAMDTNKDT